MAEGLGDSDKAQLILNGEKVVISESYEVKAAYLEQPAGFSLRLGWGDVTRELIRKYPPNTPFQLKIGGRTYQTGTTDGYNAAPTSGATELTIDGRDIMSALHDSCVEQEVSFANASYADMVTKAIKVAGIVGAEVVYSNETNRTAITGANPKQLKPPGSIKSALGPIGGGIIKRDPQAKLGEKWYAFIKRHLDRAGLFLSASGDGKFILSEPNTHQKPLYRIIRQRGQTNNAVSATSGSLRNNTVGRFAAVSIYAKGGGKKAGRTKAKGEFVDDEMASWGYQRILALKDANCDNKVKAEFMARRKLAEGRRRGWQLSYTVPGHITTAIGGGTAVWAIDTMVEVKDDEFGIDDTFWIEACAFKCDSSGTSTQLTLMRKTDLIFGEDD